MGRVQSDPSIHASEWSSFPAFYTILSIWYIISKPWSTKAQLSRCDMKEPHRSEPRHIES